MPASARPAWRGQLRLALVSCPIRLIPATTGTDRIRFHKINRATGNRLRQQMIDAETGDVVAADETVMGYEFDKGRYVTIDKSEIDALKIESSDTISIERVVPAAEVDWLYWDTPYAVQPDGKTGLDIFATIRDAIGRKRVVGIGRAVMARRERPVMISARGKGMMITTLRDPDEVRAPEQAFDDIPAVKVNDEYLAMAETLIDRMKGRFDLDLFEDRYQDALQALVEAKMKGQKPVVAAEPERGGNVINLLDALKASLAGTAPSRRETAARTRAKPTGRKAAAGKAAARSAPAAKRRKRA